MEAYGIKFHDRATAAIIDLWMAFNIVQGNGSLHETKGFLGAFEHLRRAIDGIWNTDRPLLIWNDWSETMVRECVSNRETVVAGPSASWKSTCAAVYALAFWFADPLNTKVIISSTSLGGLRERVWKDILHFFHGSRCG